MKRSGHNEDIPKVTRQPETTGPSEADKNRPDVASSPSALTRYSYEYQLYLAKRQASRSGER